MRRIDVGKNSLRVEITNRTDNPCLEPYLNEINKFPLISPEEEVELARRIKEGDKNALDTLVQANLRFVVSVAKPYQNVGVDLMDLISEGNNGLIKAAKEFDETRGNKFISYAVYWVRAEIYKAIQSTSKTIRLKGGRLNNYIGKYSKIVEKFRQEYGREPSLIEVAEELKVPIDTVQDIIRIPKKGVSFDSPFNNDGDNTLLNIFPDKNSPVPDEELMQSSLGTDLGRVLSVLTDEREKFVIKAFFGIGTEAMSLEEIAKKFGFTRERARQIKATALKRLQKSPEIGLLKKYLG
ncbi:RNA polymerase subunit sigma [bacterium DOLZORAL124_38_8]|nr:MAG: RNA polymerase subunit sigma [bacterium DOLZORAL124_38_8]